MPEFESVFDFRFGGEGRRQAVVWLSEAAAVVCGSDDGAITRFPPLLWAGKLNITSNN